MKSFGMNAPSETVAGDFSETMITHTTGSSAKNTTATMPTVHFR